VIGLVTAALAAHRGARAIAEDDIAQPFRDRLKVWSIDVDATDAQVARREWLVKLVECPLCVGHWLALAATIGMFRVQRRRPSPMELWLTWWAVSGLQGTLSAHQTSLLQKKDEVKAITEVAKAVE